MRRRAPSSRSPLLTSGLAACGLLLVTCHQAPPTAPTGTTMQIFANPDFIQAHTGVSVISVLLTEPAGTLVPDGTVVQFFTTLGQIDEQGRTNDGVARVNLRADSRSGEATVTAASGPVNATVVVRIGGVLPSAVAVRADPPRITNSGSTHVFAIVTDASANPVSNVQVVFTVVNDPATEFMDSAGAPIFTDTNGQAEDVMRTQRTTSGTATVRATVLGSGTVEGEVQIPIVR
jgi:hypothetical protein